MTGEVLRRKVRSVQRRPADGGTIGERAWRLAFSKALHDEARVHAEFTTLTSRRMSLTEVLELPFDRALILMLEGPRDGLGLLVLSPEVTAGIIEVMTLGRCSPVEPDPRRPTRTDAAMVAPAVDRAMTNLEAALEAEPDLVWADGFRHASFIEDARPLGLLLEDVPYRVMSAELSISDGLRTGRVTLALPAEGRGRRPEPRPDAIPEVAARPVFAARLTMQVELAEARIDAVLARLILPIAEAMDLREGQVIALPEAGLDQISLRGMDGRVLAEARLGQSRGMRAVRLTSLSGQQKGAIVSPFPATGQGDPLFGPLAATGTS